MKLHLILDSWDPVWSAAPRRGSGVAETEASAEPAGESQRFLQGARRTAGHSAGRAAHLWGSQAHETTWAEYSPYFWKRDPSRVSPCAGTSCVAMATVSHHHHGVRRSGGYCANIATRGQGSLGCHLGAGRPEPVPTPVSCFQAHFLVDGAGLAKSGLTLTFAIGFSGGR